MLNKQIAIKEINEALNQVRPHLAVDGGDVEVIDVSEEGVVKIKWLGNCQNCSMSTLTLKAGIEATLKQQIPNIKSVEAVVD
ncbi:MAG: NifU family protein [Saprospiraceae bacterium]|nr:NifU family protein [Saprospiraceae bacterium]